MKVITTIALLLLIIGGLNWGLVGFFDYNLVQALFGAETPLTRVIYGLVGLAAVWKLAVWIVRRTRASA